MVDDHHQEIDFALEVGQQRMQQVTADEINPLDLHSASPTTSQGFRQEWQVQEICSRHFGRRTACA